MKKKKDTTYKSRDINNLCQFSENFNENTKDNFCW